MWPRLVENYGKLDLYKYISHKLLRWLGLVPLVLAWVLLGAGLAWAGHPLLLVALLAGVILSLLAGSAHLPGFATATQILVAILATFLGVTDALRGRKIRVWTPAASRN